MNNNLPIPFSHDAFLKFVLKNETDARSFFKGALPDNIRNELDLSTLKITDDSYVDENLRQTFSDLVYEIDGQEDKKFKLLLIAEHKSSLKSGHEKFQLNGYFYLATRGELNKKITERRIPLLVLITNGVENPKIEPIWKLFGGNAESFSAGIPDFECVVIDFNTFDNDKINTLFDSFKVRAMLRVMRDYKRKIKLLQSLDAALNDLLTYCDYQSERAFINALLNYVISTADLKKEQINKALDNHKTIKTEAMTLAERLINEGMQKGIKTGMQQGMQKGLQEGMQKGTFIEKLKIALKLVKNEHSDSLIENLTGLSLQQIAVVREHFEKYNQKAIENIDELVAVFFVD